MVDLRSAVVRPLGRPLIAGPLLAGLLTVCCLCGCRPSQPTEHRDQEASLQRMPVRGGEPPEPLRVLVLGDRRLATAIEREWIAQSTEAMEVRNISDTPPDPTALQGVDLVVFPDRMLGELAERRLIRPLPEGVSPKGSDAMVRDYDWPDVLPLIRRETVRWGKDVYAVSFGSPSLMLLYRSDIFATHGLQPPSRWSAYREVAERLGTLAAAEGTSRRLAATAEPWGPGWAARLLLARAACYVRERSQYSTLFRFTDLRPLINTPGYVRALREMQQVCPVQSVDALQMDPAGAVSLLVEGRAAMAVGYPPARWPMTDGEPSVGVMEPVGRFAIAPLPTGDQVYRLAQQSWQQRGGTEPVPLLGIAGRLGAVARGSRRPVRAAYALLWMTGKRASAQISPDSLSTAPFRQTHLDQLGPWLATPFAPAMGEYRSVQEGLHGSSQWMHVLRLPAAEKYMQSLDAAVRGALFEPSTDAQETLDRVARQWEELTEAIGRERQVGAYQRSLGL